MFYDIINSLVIDDNIFFVKRTGFVFQVLMIYLYQLTKMVMDIATQGIGCSRTLLDFFKDLPDAVTDVYTGKIRLIYCCRFYELRPFRCKGCCIVDFYAQKHHPRLAGLYLYVVGIAYAVKASIFTGRQSCMR